MYGYMGTILKVNLTSAEIQREEFDEQFARMFPDGNGFVAHRPLGAGLQTRREQKQERS